MTFSIVGAVGDACGVAVASKLLSAGAVVPAARSGVGAVATQAMAKMSYKDDVLRLLGDGLSAPEAVAEVTAADPEAAHRQLGVAAHGSEATFTGEACLPWAGGMCGSDDTGGMPCRATSWSDRRWSQPWRKPGWRTAGWDSPSDCSPPCSPEMPPAGTREVDRVRPCMP